eukprot:4067403-Prymnesium_polylepis.1
MCIRDRSQGSQGVTRVPGGHKGHRGSQGVTRVLGGHTGHTRATRGHKGHCREPLRVSSPHHVTASLE